MPVRQIIPTERQEEQASPAQDTDQRESVGLSRDLGKLYDSQVRPRLHRFGRFL